MFYQFSIYHASGHMSALFWWAGYGLRFLSLLTGHPINGIHSVGEGQCPECGHRFLHHPECKSGCVFIDRLMWWRMR